MPRFLFIKFILIGLFSLGGAVGAEHEEDTKSARRPRVLSQLALNLADSPLGITVSFLSVSDLFFRVERVSRRFRTLPEEAFRFVAKRDHVRLEGLPANTSKPVRDIVYTVLCMRASLASTSLPWTSKEYPKMREVIARSGYIGLSVFDNLHYNSTRWVSWRCRSLVTPEIQQAIRQKDCAARELGAVLFYSRAYGAQSIALKDVDGPDNKTSLYVRQMRLRYYPVTDPLYKRTALSLWKKSRNPLGVSSLITHYLNLVRVENKTYAQNQGPLAEVETLFTMCNHDVPLSARRDLTAKYYVLAEAYPNEREDLLGKMNVSLQKLDEMLRSHGLMGYYRAAARLYFSYGELTMDPGAFHCSAKLWDAVLRLSGNTEQVTSSHWSPAMLRLSHCARPQELDYENAATAHFYDWACSRGVLDQAILVSNDTLESKALAILVRELPKTNVAGFGGHYRGLALAYARYRHTTTNESEQQNARKHAAALWDLLIQIPGCKIYAQDYRNAENECSHIEGDRKYAKRSAQLLDLLLQMPGYQPRVKDYRDAAEAHYSYGHELLNIVVPEKVLEREAAFKRSAGLWRHVLKMLGNAARESDYGNAAEALFYYGEYSSNAVEKAETFRDSARLRDMVLKRLGKKNDEFDYKMAVVSYAHYADCAMNDLERAVAYKRVAELREKLLQYGDGYMMYRIAHAYFKAAGCCGIGIEGTNCYKQAEKWARKGLKESDLYFSSDDSVFQQWVRQFQEQSGN